jgi:hypothetical protein
MCIRSPSPCSLIRVQVTRLHPSCRPGVSGAKVVTQVGAPAFESAYSWGRSMDREDAIAGLDPGRREY